MGGTKILAGRVCPESGDVAELVERPTPAVEQGADALEDAIVEAVCEVFGGGRPASVGIGAAGFVDVAGDSVRFAPHLAWRDRPVREVLADRLRVPVALENDASCAAVAECRYGAGRGARSVLMVTVGTGIGGALVVDGRLVRGMNGMAGEFGHMRLVPDGLACQCGLAGCWEQYCSGPALVRRAQAGMAAGPSVLHDRTAGTQEVLTGKAVGRAAAEGDSVASTALRAVGDSLGAGLADLVAAFDPEVVVVGGGVAAAGELLLAPARQALARHLVGAAHRRAPAVVGATLGSAACVVGAAALAAELA